MRARQRNRNYSVTKGHLIRTGGNSDSYDPKWGHFLPSQRFNFDHSPMPFLSIQKKMYEIIEPGDRYQKRCISQPSSGFNKRQCTLQVCTREYGSQRNIAIIFEGTCTRTRLDEKAAYDPDADVYWQTNAWAYTECFLN